MYSLYWTLQYKTWGIKTYTEPENSLTFIVVLSKENALWVQTSQIYELNFFFVWKLAGSLYLQYLSSIIKNIAMELCEHFSPFPLEKGN